VYLLCHTHVPDFKITRQFCVYTSNIISEKLLFILDLCLKSEILTPVVKNCNYLFCTKRMPGWTQHYSWLCNAMIYQFITWNLKMSLKARIFDKKWYEKDKVSASGCKQQIAKALNEKKLLAVLRNKSMFEIVGGVFLYVQSKDCVFLSFLHCLRECVVLGACSFKLLYSKLLICLACNLNVLHLLSGLKAERVKIM